MIPRIAPLRLQVAFRLALEIRAGDVVQQQVVVHIEQFAKPLLQEFLERFLVGAARCPRLDTDDLHSPSPRAHPADPTSRWPRRGARPDAVRWKVHTADRESKSWLSLTKESLRVRSVASLPRRHLVPTGAAILFPAKGRRISGCAPRARASYPLPPIPVPCS